MYTTALTSAHEYMVVYRIMSECGANSLFRDVSGTSAIGSFLSSRHGFLGKSGLSGNSGIVSNAASTSRAVLLNLSLNLAKFGLCMATCNSIHRLNNE